MGDTAAATEEHRLVVRISTDVHERLKVEAARQDRSVASVVRRVLEGVGLPVVIPPILSPSEIRTMPSIIDSPPVPPSPAPVSGSVAHKEKPPSRTPVTDAQIEDEQKRCPHPLASQKSLPDGRRRCRLCDLIS